MTPIPKGEDCFKIIVIEDIIASNINTNGSMPDIIPKGYITWVSEHYIESILENDDETIHPEHNRWNANIPAKYFRIFEINTYELW